MYNRERPLKENTGTDIKHAQKCTVERDPWEKIQVQTFIHAQKCTAGRDPWGKIQVQTFVHAQKYTAEKIQVQNLYMYKMYSRERPLG